MRAPSRNPEVLNRFAFKVLEGVDLLLDRLDPTHHAEYSGVSSPIQLSPAILLAFLFYVTQSIQDGGSCLLIINNLLLEFSEVRCGAGVSGCLSEQGYALVNVLLSGNRLEEPSQG